MFLFIPNTFVFSISLEQLEYKNIQNNKITNYDIWFWNIVYYIQGWALTKGIRKQDPEANI